MRLSNSLLRFYILHQYSDCMRRSLCDNGVNLYRSRRGVLISNLATTFDNSLTGGIFSTTLLLLLLRGASSNEYVFFIAQNTAVISFAGMAQFLSPILFERLKRRRSMINFLMAIYYIINIALLPMLVLTELPISEKAYIYIIASGVMTACNALCTPAYNVWMMHCLPENCRSDYLVFQNMATELLTQILSLLLAIFMDFFKAHNAAMAGILIMRTVAVVAVFIQFIARNHMAEPEYNSDIQRVTFKEMLLTPLSSKSFLSTVLIAMLWSFGTTFGGTYYSAYLLDGAKLSYTYISICGILGIPLNFYLLPFWNRIISKRGWLPAISVSMILYGICYSFNAMVTEHSEWMYLISTVYCMAIAGGVTLGNINLPFLYMPKSLENSCLAFFNLCTSLSAMAAAVVAERFCRVTKNIPLNLFGLSLENRAYMSFISCILLILNGIFVFLVYHYHKKKQSK